MKNKQKIKEIFNENKILVVLSIFFAIIFAFARMSGDDVGGMHVEGGNFASYWEKSIGMYYTWASRVLVNFVVFVFTDNNPIYWAIYNGISMLVLLVAIKELFIVTKDNKTDIIFMACLVMLFPYWHLSSAGWMATVTTYFSPIAFGMMSLVPIKKIMVGEKLVWWKFLLYLICLIYGTNNEQVMVVVLLSYLVAFVWHLVVNKKMNVYLSINTIAAIGSAIFTITCPGNAARKVAETSTWFPAFEHMNIIDKAELGYETASQWLVFGNNLFFEVVCLLLFIMVFLKYEDKYIRIISAIPAAITIILGPMKTLITGIYPQIDSLTASIPYWGLVNTSNRGGLGPYTEFFIMSICLILVLVDVFLLSREWKDFVISLILIVGGFASRLAMGISPTIYASSVRTNAVMCFCIIAVMVYIYSINKDIFRTENRSVLKEQNVIGVMEILAALSALNFVYVVYNTFLS